MSRAMEHHQKQGAQTPEQMRSRARLLRMKAEKEKHIGRKHSYNKEASQLEADADAAQYRGN